MSNPDLTIQLNALENLRDQVTNDDLYDDGRYFRCGCGDLTSCHHGDTGNYSEAADGKAIALLWNLWRSGALAARATHAPKDNAALVEAHWQSAMAAANNVISGLMGENAHLKDVIREMVDCPDDAANIARAALSSRAAAPTPAPAVAAWKCVDLFFHSYTIHTSDDEIIPHRQRRPDEYRITPLYAHPHTAGLTTPPEDVGAMTPAMLLALYDRSISGENITAAEEAMARKITLASAFAAQAYEYGHGGNEAHALCRSFLIALIDPTSGELDYLRADPASGAVERAKLKGGA